MKHSRRINIQDVIDAAPVSTFQWRVLACCFLVVTVDGFDTAAIGFIAPAIRQQWQLDAAHLAPLFGAGLLGLALGALLFGPLADRWGRKTVMLLCVGFFGLTSLLSALAPDINTLTLLRFLTGLGLGGAMPNTITLTSEFLPKRRRAGLVTLMFCGFTLGSALGGLVSAQLVPYIGWQGILAIGGVAPLLLLGVLAFALPESPRYRVLRKRQPQKVAALLQQINGENYDNAWFYLPEQPATSGSVVALFQRGVLPITLLLWCVFFMSLMIVYLLSSWLPTLLNNSGIDLQYASWVTAMFQVGGTLGAIVIGQLMDRHNPYRVLMISYGMGALFILLIGVSEGALWSMAFMVLGTGIGISGSQVGLNALSATLYPTDCRATGVSWANAIGRCGAILGSLSGAVMLSFNLSFSTIFMFIAIPALIAVLALGLLFVQVRGEQQPVPTRG